MTAAGKNAAGWWVNTALMACAARRTPAVSVLGGCCECGSASPQARTSTVKPAGLADVHVRQEGLQPRHPPDAASLTTFGGLEIGRHGIEASAARG
jgi:hypothetical protein